MELLDYTRHAVLGLVKCPSKVAEQKRNWRTVLPIALLMLVIGTTLGGKRGTVMPNLPLTPARFAI